MHEQGSSDEQQDADRSPKGDGRFVETEDS